MSTHNSSPRATAQSERPDMTAQLLSEDLSGRSLLAVFAHPDDESLACGGLLAWCAQLGAQVSLLCATHGEHGPENDGGRVVPSSPASLREIRARELRAASSVLGVANLLLLDYEDGMLAWTDGEQLEADIRDAIRRLRPDVVITFGEDGLYWHPDHIAVHERTTAAVTALGDEAPALYYVSMPPGSMRAVLENAASTVARGGGEPPRLILGIADVDAFGALAPAPTLVVETGDFATRKLAAIRCHRSQLADDALAVLAESDAARLLGIEHYRCADVGSREETFIERFASPHMSAGGARHSLVRWGPTPRASGARLPLADAPLQLRQNRPRGRPAS
jgi:LmbE family N-acetylglucosaminyl deacetylase